MCASLTRPRPPAAYAVHNSLTRPRPPAARAVNNPLTALALPLLMQFTTPHLPVSSSCSVDGDSGGSNRRPGLFVPGRGVAAAAACSDDGGGA